MEKSEVLKVLEGHPYIQSKINIFWGSEYMPAYLEMILIQDREKRLGFKFEVVQTLIALYDEIKPQEEFMDSDWLTNPKEHNQLPKNW